MRHHDGVLRTRIAAEKWLQCLYRYDLYSQTLRAEKRMCWKPSDKAWGRNDRMNSPASRLMVTDVARDFTVAAGRIARRLLRNDRPSKSCWAVGLLAVHYTQSRITCIRIERQRATTTPIYAAHHVHIAILCRVSRRCRRNVASGSIAARHVRAYRGPWNTWCPPWWFAGKVETRWQYMSAVFVPCDSFAYVVVNAMLEHSG